MCDPKVLDPAAPRSDQSVTSQAPCPTIRTPDHRAQSQPSALSMLLHQNNARTNHFCDAVRLRGSRGHDRASRPCTTSSGMGKRGSTSCSWIGGELGFSSPACPRGNRVNSPRGRSRSRKDLTGSRCISQVPHQSEKPPGCLSGEIRGLTNGRTYRSRFKAAETAAWIASDREPVCR